MSTKTKQSFKIFKDPMEKLNNLKVSMKEEKDRKARLKKAYDSILTEQDVLNFIRKYIPANLPEETQKELKREVVKHYLKNLDKEAQKQKKDYKQVNDEILKKAYKEVSGYCNSTMDSDLYKKIMNLQCLGDQLIYLNKAEESQKWINYAIWVSVDSKAIGITHIDEETKQFVNGICKLLHSDLQYKNSGIADLELYDPWISGWNDQKFILNIEKVKKLLTINFLDRVNMKNNRPSTNYSFPVPPSNLTKPITFASPNAGNTLTDPSLEVEDYIQANLDQVVLPYLNGRSHRYEKEQGTNCYRLIIDNPYNMIPEEYHLVVGYHGKGIVSLITTNILGQRVIIHPSCSRLWNDILNNYFYSVSETDTNEASQYQSVYFWIYDAIDLSTISEDEIRLNKLDAKLNSVFYNLQNNGVNLTNIRYRFDTYNSASDFTLVSDGHMSNPFNNSTDNSIIIVKDYEACYKLNNIFMQVQC